MYTGCDFGTLANENLNRSNDYWLTLIGSNFNQIEKIIFDSNCSFNKQDYGKFAFFTEYKNKKDFTKRIENAYGDTNKLGKNIYLHVVDIWDHLNLKYLLKTICYYYMQTAPYEMIMKNIFFLFYGLDKSFNIKTFLLILILISVLKPRNVFETFFSQIDTVRFLNETNACQSVCQDGCTKLACTSLDWQNGVCDNTCNSK